MSMQKGTIAKWMKEKGFGFIQPENTQNRDDQIFAHSSQVNIPAAQLREGTIVLYEMGTFRGRPQAQNVRLPGTEKETPSQGYRFLNPYNFVRYLPHREVTSDNPDVQLMGQTEPPTHDRWIGLSGRITCQLETVTPLFVSDAEDKQVEKEMGAKKKHFSYRFFRLGDQKAIPASSLRGMVRSVFEAVTNSAFSNLGGERLSYRLPSGEVQKLVPARVVKQKQDDQVNCFLHLLPGSAPFAPQLGQKKGLYAAPARFYEAVKPTGRRRHNPPPPIANSHQWQHGQAYFAILRQVKFPPSWRVLDLLPTQEEAEKKLRVLQREWQDKLVVRSGWLCKTNQNSDSKNSERFFFREPGRQDVPEQIPLPKAAREKYESLILDYQTRHESDVKKRRRPDQLEGDDIAFSRFILQKKERQLQGGELVYVHLNGRSPHLEVDFIAPVSWPRVAYNREIIDLLPKHLQRNKNLELLDPASRVFGWVHGGKDQKRDIAYAGRVRFSHGLLQKAGESVGKKTLSILGSPKPTTTRFYLIDRIKKEPQNGRSDLSAGYDGNNQLRGRKFYRHFFPREEHLTKTEQSDQNRTIRDAEGKGAIFTFTVEFENMAPVELGALLWALTLDGKGVHKLGYGKPLGLGSVDISVSDMVLYDMVSRYGSLKDDGIRPFSPKQQAQRIAQFREAMCRHYIINEEILAAANTRGETGWQIVFEELPNVQDLLALHNKQPPKLPVHYPYSPDPRSKGQFEWFVGNNRLHGPKVELGLAVQDRGLPFIKRDGSEQN